MSTPHTTVLSNTRIDVREEHGGRVARVILRSPPDNALDSALLDELHRTLDSLARAPALACVVLEGDGKDFSPGLNLSQRRRPYVELLLSSLHAAARRLATFDALLVAKVRGRCQGAGLELAILCDAILCDSTARFGVPDLSMGAFAPLASILLPERLGHVRGAELLLSARTIAADEALPMGLVNECAGGWDDLESIATRYLERNVLSRPTLALRAQGRALRQRLLPLLGAPLDELEKLYLEGIAGSRDAEEGISAALRRREPRWTHA